jgi:hypothetical protein
LLLARIEAGSHSKKRWPKHASSLIDVALGQQVNAYAYRVKAR